ncbi:MAG: hypothetical protein LC098_11680 [Burkholderiales bacterium]|nr:hypothetical protein [Burkholderiales bacterium]
MLQLAKKIARNPLFLRTKSSIDGIFTKFVIFQVDFTRISAAKPVMDAASSTKLLTDSPCVSRGARFGGEMRGQRAARTPIVARGKGEAR